MAGHTNFSPTTPVPLVFMMLGLGNLWNFQSDLLLIFTVHNENPKNDIQ